MSFTAQLPSYHKSSHQRSVIGAGLALIAIAVTVLILALTGSAAVNHPTSAATPSHGASAIAATQRPLVQREHGYGLVP